MEYKLLLNRKKNALVNDLLAHTDLGLRSLSTSEVWEDVKNHLDFFKPDAFVCFYEAGDNYLLGHLTRIRECKDYDDVLFILVADDDSMDDFTKKKPMLRVAYIRSPITINALEDKITSLCTSEQNARRKAEEQYQENMKRIAEEKRLEKEIREQEEIERRRRMKEETDAIIGKQQILIIDDDRNILKMLKAALEDEYDVTTIVNGAMAMKFLQTKPCDLILLDYEMPIMTGAQVFSKIKEVNEFSNIPVVFLTGVSDTSKIMEVMALKPAGYLLKPIDVEKLKEKVRDLLEI